MNVLLPQAEQLGIDVCISDNASPDSTGEYLKSLSSQYKCFRYFIQPSNLGLEQNMIKAMSMAETNYILPIGDDEIMVDGALRLIIAKLIDKQPDLLILNGWHISSNSKYRREHLPARLQNHLFDNPIEAFPELWDKMPLGSFVVSKYCFNDRYFNNFLGTSHAYSAMVWEYLLEKFKLNGKIHIECSAEHTVLFRSVKKSYSFYSMQIHFYEIPQWFIRLSLEYNRVSRVILSQYIDKQSKFASLLKYRADGQLTHYTVYKFMGEFSDKQRKKALLITKVPQNVAKFLLLAIKIISTIKNRWL